ncbi:MAG: PAS domain-containing sensor histidine kinase [Desulfobacter sp.]|nr:MAG: PAS domain-containing sensor histidine kinase [Desulfobacter sp.]
MDSVSQAEKILDQTYVRYKTIFENTGTATILIENDMTISMVNSELERISGIEKSSIEGKMKFPELLAEEDREKVIANHRLRRRDPEKAPRNYPCRVMVEKGEIKECILTVALIKGTKQSVASITDISKQKQLEREIARISEEERRQMGQVLHDDLGSHLAGVEAMSSLLAGRLEKQGHPEAELAGEIRELVNQAIQKTRAMIRGLVPVNLADTGFMNAFQRYAKEVEKAFGMECRVDIRIPRVQFSNATALTHVYYIIREAVNNAAKHGEARVIDIRLEERGADFLVDIRDDGRGMAGADGPGKGIGLVIMQHRADLIGARLEIIDNPSGGTIVRCRIAKKYLL